MDTSELASVEGLIRSRQKILAIKRLRELGGQGLKEAKDAVEHFEAHGQWRASDVSAIAGRGQAAAPLAQPAEPDPGEANASNPPPVEQITALVRAGRKIEAIKRYRELTGLGLKEAKDAVEAMVSGGAVTATAPRNVQAPSQANHGLDPTPVAPSVPDDSETERARRAMVAKYPDAETPLAAARAECGLYQGHLFVTDRRVVFVADRYGNLEVTESLERSELEKVEANHDPFGYELVLEAGFHTARFSALDEATATNLARTLQGKGGLMVTPRPEPLATRPFAASEPALPAPWSNGNDSGPERAPQFHESPARAGETRRPFSFPRVLFSALGAGLPVTVYGSAWRVIPMDEFPAIANAVLYWTALGLGAAVRGRAGAMLTTCVVVGALGWLVGDVAGLHTERLLLALFLLGGAYGRALSPRATVLHAFLAIAVYVLNSATLALSGPVSSFPLLGFWFWFVHFAVEDVRRSRVQPSTAPTGGGHDVKPPVG